jgi:hypothetical protein
MLPNGNKTLAAAPPSSCQQRAQPRLAAQADAEGHHSIRNRRRVGSRAAQDCLVPIVEREKQLADIAAMAGMASDDVSGCHQSLPATSEIRDDLLYEFEIGLESDERGHISGRMRSNQESGPGSSAMRLEPRTREPRELLTAIDDHD